MTAIEYDVDLPETEEDRVLGWRFDQLARAGFDDEAALVLALSRDVDLHLATSLLDRGCPPGTALSILL
jgi:hypothetical protein